MTAWLGAIDHKRVGILYMLSALLFFLAGGMEAMVMRAQLAAPRLQLITPELYDQMFTMHGTTMIFLVTGTIFWWPIFGPLRDCHLSPLAAVTYSFSACSSCTLLGAYLTFGPAGLYPAYTGYLGLDAKADQQLGGLLMWVPGCFVYLSAILITVRRWYAEPYFSRIAV